MVDQGKMETIVTAIRAGEKVSIDDGLDVWIFEPVQQPPIERLGQQYTAVAANISQSCLYRRTGDPLSLDTRLYLIDQDRVALHSFSLQELINRAGVQKQAAALGEGKLKDYRPLLEEYASCPGSQYWIANEMTQAVHDERAPREWENVSLDLYRQLAENGDARACHELANHYYFNAGDKDAVIKWRQLAIAGGQSDDLGELADFIIDEYPEKIGLALDALHAMQQYNMKAAEALWKEGDIYTKGIGGLPPDPQRGVALVQKASDLGHTAAKADLAFNYYYRGVGVSKDPRKALALLQEANEASRQFNNPYYSPGDESDEPLEEGDYEDEIETIKKELGL